MSNQREEETIPVGFRATKQQRDELQRWVSYFGSQKSIDLELVGHYSTSEKLVRRKVLGGFLQNHSNSLSQKPSKIDTNYLQRHPSFQESISAKGEKTSKEEEVTATSSKSSNESLAIKL